VSVNSPVHIMYVHLNINPEDIQQVLVCTHRVHIFTRDDTGSVYLPTQLEHTLQLYW
jgi:hypothetical protein